MKLEAFADRGGGDFAAAQDRLRGLALAERRSGAPGDFPNLRFRDIESLKIDRFQVSFYAGQNPNGKTRKWYDGLVAATEYIGPMAK